MDPFLTDYAVLGDFAEERTRNDAGGFEPLAWRGDRTVEGMSLLGNRHLPALPNRSSNAQVCIVPLGAPGQIIDCKSSRFRPAQSFHIADQQKHPGRAPGWAEGRWTGTWMRWAVKGGGSVGNAPFSVSYPTLLLR